MNLKILLVFLSYISITFAASLSCKQVKKKVCSSCSNDNYQCKTDTNGNIYSLLINNQNFSNGIPDIIFTITSLKDFKITSIPSKIENLKKLRRLDLRVNKLTELPKEIGKLSNLKYLKLSNNDIVSLPSSIGNLKSLIKLYFTNCKLTSIPSSIKNLVNLEELVLDDNCIEELPSELIGKSYVSFKNNNGNRCNNSCSKLKNKICSTCKTDDFECKANENGDIYHLKIKNNDFSEAIPDDIFDLTSLEYLSLESNQISFISGKITNLENLNELNLINNQLRFLPYNIGSISNLKILSLDNNCIEHLPWSIDQDKVNVSLENNGVWRCSKLPVVYLTTSIKDWDEMTSKEDSKIWDTDSEISIISPEKEEWSFTTKKTSVRLRGNTTRFEQKKPFNIKLDKKQSILGMPESKRWVLIANYFDSSYLRNELANYLSECLDLYHVNGQFVNLVLNGQYNGLYWLAESIKVDKNRINIDDGKKGMTDDEDKDYLIEIDTNYDEPIKFISNIRRLPYMIKNDDYMIDDETKELTTGGKARLERFKNRINNLEKLLYPDFEDVEDIGVIEDITELDNIKRINTNKCSVPDESYNKIIDIDTFAKLWVVNEIMSNLDFRNPRSVFFTYEMKTNKFKAGPVWDYDYASLYLNEDGELLLSKSIYYNALFKSPSFIKRLKEIKEEYFGNIDLEKYIDSMSEKLSTDAEYDLLYWGIHEHPLKGFVGENHNDYVEFLKLVVTVKLSVVIDNIDKL
ncbi:L domain-like protein [Anaeromyces robustus]|uniref:L domain-like protein n=1 Tax=Anaeromyces robustus TaxID=1754192 RepID=A0A1Y1WVK8_9FUNG|nr:L domain-like protein [Anaeromyces robustus]|eukprot:ORX77338.1 L domain-like protein [Anaeromyces robustus]